MDFSACFETSPFDYIFCIDLEKWELWDDYKIDNYPSISDDY